MLSVLVLVILVLFITYSYYSSREYRRTLSKIKSVPSLPLIGHAHKLRETSKDLLPVLEKMWIDTGRDKFLLKIGPTAHVSLSKPEDVEALLVTHRVIKKHILYDQLANMMGRGLLTAHESYWAISRKTLKPAFYSKVLESHIEVYNTQARLMLKNIMSISNKDIDVLDMFIKSFLIVLTTAGIGLSINSDEVSEYINIITNLISVINDRIFSIWKGYNFLFNLTSEGKLFRKQLQWIHEINRGVLKKKRKTLGNLMDDIKTGKSTLEDMAEEENFFKRRFGVLDLLLLGTKTNGEPFTDKEIVAEVITFTIAGAETTSVAAAFTLNQLSLHPYIQKVAIEEQIELTNGDLSKPVTFNEIKGMKYLEAVIKESMRLYSPIIFFGRKIDQDFILPDGTVLPGGVNILLLPFFSHKHPSIFPNPDKFDPNRFIDKTPPAYAYYPFGCGPRDCIGKNLAMLLIKFYVSTFLRSIELLPPTGPKPVLAVEIGLKPSNGVNIRWKKRQT